MLYDPRLPASKLGVTQRELDALDDTLFAMENGKVPGDRFDMRSWKTCIHGTCKRLTGVAIGYSEPGHPPPVHLHKLFCGYPKSIAGLIGVKHAARALRSWRMTGDPHWTAALVGLRV